MLCLPPSLPLYLLCALLSCGLLRHFGWKPTFWVSYLSVSGQFVKYLRARNEKRKYFPSPSGEKRIFPPGVLPKAPKVGFLFFHLIQEQTLCSSSLSLPLPPPSTFSTVLSILQLKARRPPLPPLPSSRIWRRTKQRRLQAPRVAFFSLLRRRKKDFRNSLQVDPLCVILAAKCSSTSHPEKRGEVKHSDPWGTRFCRGEKVKKGREERKLEDWRANAAS